MRGDLRIPSVALFVFAIYCMVSGSAPPAQAALAAAAPSLQPVAPAPARSWAACLSCHGPFEKLVANAGYQAPGGEKISPHRHVPHSSKGITSIPGCDNCHATHPVPPSPAAVAALPRPDVQWCYTSCHHKHTFQPCKDCHNHEMRKGQKFYEKCLNGVCPIPPEKG